jgi:hypothetical protein
MKNIFDQSWFFQPVGGAEGLGAEGSFAGFACKPLDTLPIDLSLVGSCFFEEEPLF